MVDPARDGLFARLRAASAREWDIYVRHPFVRALGDGSLPEASFRHYLVQDYLFLIQFARAWALAAYKSDTLPELRQASATMRAILDVEMDLHVKFCAGWGVSEAEMAAAPEASATMAYTRFVLERGAAGDRLDLEAALAPCIIGYAEIGARLAREHARTLAGNPYRAWIRMYAGNDYQSLAQDAVAALDRLWHERAGAGRLAVLTRTFAQATRLEADFWQMSLDRAE